MAWVVIPRLYQATNGRELLNRATDMESFVVMAKKYRVRPFLSQAHYIAIGRAIATWAALEIKIDEPLLRMLRHTNAFPIRQRENIHLRNHIPKGLKKRMNLFNELAKVIYKGQPLAQHLSVSKRCLTLAKDRHRLAHGEWLIEYLPHKTKLTSRMWHAGVPTKERIFTIHQIRQSTHDICDLYVDLYTLMRAYPPRPLAEEFREFFGDLLRKPSP